MVATMDWIEFHIIQRVVHPAEIPFEPEAEAAIGGRTRHAGKIGGLFRHRYRAWRLLAENTVGVTQKLDRFEIFPPAVFVGDPLARFTAIVAVDHRRHRVDAQRVNAEALDQYSALPTR